MIHQKVDTAHEALKSAAPVAVAGASMLGMSIPDFVALLTGLYVLMQMGLLLPRYYTGIREWLSKRASRKSEPAPSSSQPDQ